MKISKANLNRLAKGQLPEPTEDDAQKLIVDWLSVNGYLVLITSRRVKKCWSCGKWPKSDRGDGCSKGVADLLVRHPSWRKGLWLSLECKRPGPIKYSSIEQRVYAEAGDVLVVRSIEDVVAALEALDEEVS